MSSFMGIENKLNHIKFKPLAFNNVDKDITVTIDYSNVSIVHEDPNI